MKKLRELMRRLGLVFIASTFGIITIFSSLIIQNASAAQVTTRSIKMSNSLPGTTSVTYHVSFTTATTATLKSLVVDFCTNDPIIGDTCTAPTGFTVGTPTVANVTNLPTPASWVAASLNSGRTFTLTYAANATSVTLGTIVSFDITTVTNPTSAAGSFYGRVLTYLNGSGANSAANYVAGTEGTFTDYGGIALSTTAVINVTAKVMETLAFCVYKSACSDDPSFTIGHTVGSVTVIDNSAVDTQTAHFSISTNANTGATIQFKGGTPASGANNLVADGAAATTMTAGSTTGQWGLYVSTAGTGISKIAPYNGGTGTQYAFNTANTTSTYGDQIATLAAPVNASISIITFGATAATTTPAGTYTAAEQLIATGTF